MILLDLFWTFARIGAFTFGGGYAMIPLIERETADRKGWISHADLLDIIAIAESTPGPIAINAATFIGRRWCPCSRKPRGIPSPGLSWAGCSSRWRS